MRALPDGLLGSARLCWERLATGVFENSVRDIGREPGTFLLLLYTDAGQAATFVRWLSEGGSNEVVTCPLSRPISSLIEEVQPDLILLEPPSNKEQLLEACDRVRQATERPLVVLSSLAEELAVTQALSAGADEYLVLPIREHELVARIGALARRMSRAGAVAAPAEFGGMTLSADEQSAEFCGRTFLLSPIEFRLLACLVSAQGKVVTHDYLMSHVWGAEYVNSRHYLHLYIRYLREKLETDRANPRLILSEWGIGYRFQPVLETEPS